MVIGEVICEHGHTRSNLRAWAWRQILRNWMTFKIGTQYNASRFSFGVGRIGFGAGFIAINPAQTFSVGRSMPRPYGRRGLTGAAAYTGDAALQETRPV